MKKIIVLLALVFATGIVNAQTKQEPEKKKETKTTQAESGTGSNEKAIHQKGVSGKSNTSSKKENATVKEGEGKEATEEKKEEKKPE